MNVRRNDTSGIFQLFYGVCVCAGIRYGISQAHSLTPLSLHLQTPRRADLALVPNGYGIILAQKRQEEEALTATWP